MLKRMLENNLYADDEQENGSNDEVHDTDDDFQTWCIPDELEPEQWQEAITRQSERKQQTCSQTSILCVQTKQSSVSPKVK